MALLATGNGLGKTIKEKKSGSNTRTEHTTPQRGVEEIVKQSALNVFHSEVYFIYA